MKLSNGMLIDYLCYTLPYTTDGLERLSAKFDLKELTDLGFGGMGYTSSAKMLDGGRVFWSDDKREMGIHVRLPATSLGMIDFTPLGLLNSVLDGGAKIKRLDIAMDDTEGKLNIDYMYEKLQRGEVQTRFRKRSRIQGGMLGTHEATGDTVSVGSRSSQAFIRIYDKLLEQADKGNDVRGIDHWIRVEMELKGEKAHYFTTMLAKTAVDGEGQSPGELCANLMFGLLDFKEPNENDDNKSRWDTSGWWSEFLGQTSKLKLSMPKPRKTLAASKEWVRSQVSATLAMILLAKHEDDELSGYDFVMEAIEEGAKNMNATHKRILKEHNAQFDDGIPF